MLANILATPLKMLAPLLCGHVAPGGHLVLAGILDRQADELKAAYAPWIALEVSNTRRRLDPDDGAQAGLIGSADRAFHVPHGVSDRGSPALESPSSHRMIRP